MAERLEWTGFWSYTTSDEVSADGHLSQLRLRLAKSLQLLAGRPKVSIFQDKHAIPLGTEWEKEIYKALDASSFLLPIVTPGFMQSEWCCKEVLHFREREKALGRADLIFPFIYIEVGPGGRDECYDPRVFDLLKARQRFDFGDLIYHAADSQVVRQRLGDLAGAISAALRRVPGRISPEPAPATPPAAIVPPEPFAVIRDVPDGPELVLIPAGTFTMGVPLREEDREGVPPEYRGKSSPRQSVTIAQPFWLGRYPVTRGQFEVFAAETRRELPDEAWTYEPDANGAWTYEVRKDRNWRNPGFEQSEDHPVVCVSHADAEAYVAWLHDVTGQPYRLPSEAEWEYACRAGTTAARFWGDGPGEATGYAKVADRSLMVRMKAKFDPERFFDGNSGHAFTAPVGSVLPNPFGLYDMLGNVWEWTADCWNESLTDMPRDGRARTTGDCSRRAVRGGSWGNFPGVVRAGHRSWYITGNRGTGTGFRVARTLFSP